MEGPDDGLDFRSLVFNDHHTDFRQFGLELWMCMSQPSPHGELARACTQMVEAIVICTIKYRPPDEVALM